ncbi:hypothetical protein HMPREF0043_00308 [Actinobaculum sp. oral taxon 183 str. F0552]|nr:hypothetical protein HMPREF0043_00308 [Actinobaculum sp. oral taxon 183 str. F0552]
MAMRQQAEGSGLRKAVQQAAFAQRCGARPVGPGDEAKLNRSFILKFMP